jgi:hypothetical protein
VRAKLAKALLAFAAVAAAASPQPLKRGERRGAHELVVRGGEDLQWALDVALPGDVITLDAGVRFMGPFTLREKEGAGWITIRSSAEAQLPGPGDRISPVHAQYMPKLEAADDAVLRTEPRAHHYRFVGLEIRPAPQTFLYNLILLGSDETSRADLPHGIVFERCYIHGDPDRGSRRGIALNSRDTAIVDSYLSDFKESGADSQAIAGWNGAGPFRIENNYLEAAGENVMFGGADPKVRDLVPTDIVMRRNHVAKPLAWKDRTNWTIKNLFELKNARKVVVEDNLFEQTWVQAQGGTAILFTVRNQDGTAPWSSVEDVTFANNVVRRAAGGLAILGRDDIRPSGPTRRIVIRNNLFEDIGGSRWGGGGRLFTILEGAADVVISHNTALHEDNIITADGRPHSGFVFNDNIVLQNRFGIHGLGLFPGGQFRNNVIVGGNGSPQGNFFPGSLNDVGFVDHRSGNYQLREDSPYKRAGSDGKDPGVDMQALATALSAASHEDEGRVTRKR